MRTHTPRATPMVRAPAPSSIPAPAASVRELPPLRAPVSIITPVNEVELREGSLLIGRLPECDVTLDDALVSRMHARISIREDGVVVEDLHSTNGIYVNGTRIAHSVLLREGDRLLTGTSEISLFEARSNARLTPLRLRREGDAPAERPSAPAPPAALAGRRTAATPARRSDSFGKLQLHLDELASDATPSARRALRSRDSGVPPTARADALEVIGALAERLAAGGNPDEACRVLSSHLQRILQGATAGLTVPIELCLLASHHALSLARWTGHSEWIDYVVELHLAARRAMSAATFASFESALVSIGACNRQLFTYYVESLCEQQTLLMGEELLVLERLIHLAES